jgi:hypothetical protein
MVAKAGCSRTLRSPPVKLLLMMGNRWKAEVSIRPPANSLSEALIKERKRTHYYKAYLSEIKRTSLNRKATEWLKEEQSYDYTKKRIETN